jgi:AmmeMemoRadiSam system protein A
MPYPPVHEITDRMTESATPAYSPEERRFLIEVARKAIETALEKREYRPEATTPNLKEPRAVFVTLHIGGQLRGCVGQIIATEPLVEAVAHSAVSAAFGDPRFAPLTTQEFPQLQFEISVLSPIKPIRPREIEPGVHGLLVSGGGRRGLLLPQVATEFGWGAETFLEHTCRKAGLPLDAWKQPETEIYGFTAEKFGE